jgi:hypothetical protein
MLKQQAACLKYAEVEVGPRSSGQRPLTELATESRNVAMLADPESCD